MIAWPEQTRTLTRPDGGEVSWWEVGEGARTLLWVHGLPLDSRSWEQQRAHFGTRARNVFVDLRGYGRSASLPAGVASVTDLYCADLAALIAEIGGPAPVVIGFASAGHVVLRLAARGARLAGGVCINGSPRFTIGSDWPFGFDPDALNRFAAPLRAGRVDNALDLILDPATVFRDVAPDEGARLATAYREMGRLAGARTLLGFFDEIAHDDDRGLLDRVDVPVLLLSGVLGREVPNGVGLFLREHIRRAYLVEIAGADHFAFATRPAMVNALIEDFCGTLNSETATRRHATP